MTRPFWFFSYKYSQNKIGVCELSSPRTLALPLSIRVWEKRRQRMPSGVRIFSCINNRHVQRDRRFLWVLGPVIGTCPVQSLLISGKLKALGPKSLKGHKKRTKCSDKVLSCVFPLTLILLKMFHVRPTNPAQNDILRYNNGVTFF